jgi:hypothetical protein
MTTATAAPAVCDRRKNILVQGSVVRYDAFVMSFRAVVLEVHPDELASEGCGHYVTIALVNDAQPMNRIQKVSSRNLDLVKW